MDPTILAAIITTCGTIVGGIILSVLRSRRQKRPRIGNVNNETASAISSGQDNAKDLEASALISKIQNKSVPVSQCLSEGLAFAKKHGDKTLLQFCAKELTGWSSDEAKEIDPKNHLAYRFMEAYCSPFQQINPQFVGWGTSSVLSYVRNNPDFIPKKIFVHFPTFRIGQDAIVSDPKKSILTWSAPLSDVFPGAEEYQDQRVYCYAAANSHQRILDAIRAELTNRLIGLLPGI